MLPYSSYYALGSIVVGCEGGGVEAQFGALGLSVQFVYVQFGALGVSVQLTLTAGAGVGDGATGLVAGFACLLLPKMPNSRPVKTSSIS